MKGVTMPNDRIHAAILKLHEQLPIITWEETDDGMIEASVSNGSRHSVMLNLTVARAFEDQVLAKIGIMTAQALIEAVVKKMVIEPTEAPPCPFRLPGDIDDGCVSFNGHRIRLEIPEWQMRALDEMNWHDPNLNGLRRVDMLRLYASEALEKVVLAWGHD